MNSAHKWRCFNNFHYKFYYQDINSGSVSVVPKDCPNETMDTVNNYVNANVVEFEQALNKEQ